MVKKYNDFDEITILVGENIRRFRRRLDYSQEYAAEMLGISLSTYSRMERGIAPINVKRLKKLSEILQVSFEELFLENEAV